MADHPQQRSLRLAELARLDDAQRSVVYYTSVDEYVTGP